MRVHYDLSYNMHRALHNQGRVYGITCVEHFGMFPLNLTVLHRDYNVVGAPVARRVFFGMARMWNVLKPRQNAHVCLRIAMLQGPKVCNSVYFRATMTFPPRQKAHFAADRLRNFVQLHLLAAWHSLERALNTSECNILWTFYY